LQVAGLLSAVLTGAFHEPKTVKNRLHIDVLTADIESEAQRLSHLGGHRAHNEPISEYGTQWIVMHDPERNEFCVCQM
jgi:predicted enzyme related to lactoylglutathione lyase